MPKIPSGLVRPLARISWISPKTASLRRTSASSGSSIVGGESIVNGALLTQGPVRPVAVVVSHVLLQDSFEVPAAENQHPVKALTADGADEALGEGVCSGSPDRCANDADAVSSEDLVEARSELGVSVTDQELDGMDPILQCHGQVPRLLDHPGPDRMGGDPGHMHSAGVELDEEEYVEALQQHRVDREEVTGQYR